MCEFEFEMIEPGVLKIKNNMKGPKETEHEGIKYFRFMDFFYTRTEDLDQLSPDEVSNLCRARARFPTLISQPNIEVRSLFKALALEIGPSSLLEIGAGLNPLFAGTTTMGMHYVLSDADQEVVKSHSNTDTECYIFSDAACVLPHQEGHFEMVIAVFVLHFPFYKTQLIELYRTLNKTGVIIANVYRRSDNARIQLTSDIESSGFKILKVKDTKHLCLNHEYWILGKSEAQMKICASTLKKIIEIE